MFKVSTVNVEHGVRVTRPTISRRIYLPSDQSLRVALESLMNKYTQKADELVDLGSTQNNENFNHMVASKAPKRL